MTDTTNVRTYTIDSLVCVVLDVHLWTGRRKLTPKDLLKVAPENLPPQDLASLGSKKICDPGELAIFGRLKRRAERLLLESGYRFLGGYGIPEDKLDEVRGELDALRDEFDTARAVFLAGYDQAIEQWVERHKDWETIIRKAATPVEEVADRLRFTFRIFRVAPATDGNEADGGGDSLLEGSYRSILSEVARSAGEAWENSFKGNAAVTQRALSPIRKMREKLSGLSFIDPRIYPLVEQIDEALDNCPKTGKIADRALAGLNAAVLLLSDPERMVAHGEAMTANSNAEADMAEEADEIAEPDHVTNSDESAEDTEGDVLVEQDDEVIAEEPEEEPAEAVLPRKRPATSESGLFF